MTPPLRNLHMRSRAHLIKDYFQISEPPAQQQNVRQTAQQLTERELPRSVHKSLQQIALPNSDQKWAWECVSVAPIWQPPRSVPGSEARAPALGFWLPHVLRSVPGSEEQGFRHRCRHRSSRRTLCGVLGHRSTSRLHITAVMRGRNHGSLDELLFVSPQRTGRMSRRRRAASHKRLDTHSRCFYGAC